MSRPLVIFGTGDIAELAAYLFALDTDYEIVGFTVDAAYATEANYQGKPLIPFDQLATRFPPDTHTLFIAIGYTKLNAVRAEKYQAAKAMGYRLASYISPRATVFDNVAIGENCFIFEHNVLQPFVTVGNNTVLWSGNHVGHHTRIGDHSFIASHAVISGRVVIGDRVFIGVNATVRDHITIGDGCVVGAGTILLKDAAPGEVFIATSTPPSPVPSHRLRSI